jgi:hypothetical protein
MVAVYCQDVSQLLDIVIRISLTCGVANRGTNLVL